jgi:hypothetical protein
MSTADAVSLARRVLSALSDDVAPSVDALAIADIEQLLAGWTR